MESLLIFSIKEYQETNEFKFWRYYCKKFFKDYDREELIKIIEAEENNLVPYFYLYINDLANNKPVNYYNKILLLKENIKRQATFKNKYIKSLIDSAEKQMTFRKSE